jgi:hypothetical protein
MDEYVDKSSGAISRRSWLKSSPTFRRPSGVGLISDPGPLKVGNGLTDGQVRRRGARENFFNFSRREISDFTNEWVGSCIHGLMDE